MSRREALVCGATQQERSPWHAATQATTTEQTASTGPSPRVLIVEDELLVAWHLESLVREQNLEVCGLVPDGEGAVEQAVDLDVDLILMDIRLAGRMDGIEAARRIREQRDTPIIFITAHGDQATRAHIDACCRARRCWPSRSPPSACARRSRSVLQEVQMVRRCEGVRGVTSPRSAPARRCR